MDKPKFIIIGAGDEVTHAKAYLQAAGEEVLIVENLKEFYGLDLEEIDVTISNGGRAMGHSLLKAVQIKCVKDLPPLQEHGSKFHK